MIAVDTNVLVYAHREDSPWHDVARRLEERVVIITARCAPAAHRHLALEDASRWPESRAKHDPVIVGPIGLRECVRY